MKRAFAIVLLLLCASSSRTNAGISVKASAKPDKVTIGDRIQLMIEVTHPDGLILQASTMTAVGDFLVTETALTKKDPQTDNATLTLVTFSTGTVTIPSFSLQFQNGQNQPVSVQTPEIPIQVESVLDKHKDRGDIQEIKGQVGFFDPWPWIIGLIIATLVGGIIWWIVHRKRQEFAALIPKVPPCPAEISAREALTALQNSRLIEEKRFKEFYIELSEILRRYAEGRFRVPCLDMTTSEIARELKNLPISSSDFNNLRELLQDCDLVKFAKFMPTLEEPVRHINRAFEFVDHTTPQAAPVTTP